MITYKIDSDNNILILTESGIIGKVFRYTHLAPSYIYYSFNNSVDLVMNNITLMDVAIGLYNIGLEFKYVEMNYTLRTEPFECDMIDFSAIIKQIRINKLKELLV